MITQMLLCASALMLGEPQTTEPKPQPKAEQKVEQKTHQAAKPVTPDPAEMADKVVDGVKLAAIEANIVSYTNQERAPVRTAGPGGRQGIDGNREGTCGLDDPQPGHGSYEPTGGREHRHGPAA